MAKNLKKMILYPIVIYSIISVEIAALVILGIETDTVLVWFFTTAFLATLLITFSFIAQPGDVKRGLTIGTIWAGIFLLLDILIVALPFAGAVYFFDYRAWIPYAMGILIPSLVSAIIQKRKQEATTVQGST